MILNWVQNTENTDLLILPTDSAPLEVTAILLDLPKVMQAWAMNPFCFIDDNWNSRGNVDDMRMLNIRYAVFKRSPMQSPLLLMCPGSHHEFRVQDGRHRMAAAREVEDLQIMVTVRLDQADMFLAAYT